jgi:hypothetical protein
MEIVRTNIGRIALSFTAHMMEGVVPNDDGKVEVIVYWDENDGEYVITPKWNRVKEVIKVLSLTSASTVSLSEDEKVLLKARHGLIPAIRSLRDRNIGLSLRDAKQVCDTFRAEKMYWDDRIKEYVIIGG